MDFNPSLPLGRLSDNTTGLRGSECVLGCRQIANHTLTVPTLLEVSFTLTSAKLQLHNNLVARRLHVELRVCNVRVYYTSSYQHLWLVWCAARAHWASFQRMNSGIGLILHHGVGVRDGGLVCRLTSISLTIPVTLHFGKACHVLCAVGVVSVVVGLLSFSGPWPE